MKAIIKIGEMRQTNSTRFPKVWLTKNGKKRGSYLVLVQAYDAEEDRVSGWMTAKDGSLKECREYIENF